MLIVGKERDYYDSVLKEGIDKTLVYKRDAQEFKINVNPYRTWGQSSNQAIVEFAQELRYNLPSKERNNEFDASPILVGFCGKIYLGYKLTHMYNIYPYKPILIKYVWSVDEIVQFLEEEKLEELYNKFCNLDTESKYFRKRGVGKNYTKHFNVDDLTESFEMYKNNTFLTNMFAQYRTPVFSLGFENRGYGLILTINPILKKLEFIKKIDPYTAFQEISMYLGGVLGVGQPELVKINDKEMLKKKGFDNKSFKKEKQS